MGSDVRPTFRLRLEDLLALSFFLINLAMRLIFRGIERRNLSPADVLIIIPAVSLLVAKEIVHYFVGASRTPQNSEGSLREFVRPYWEIVRDWFPFLVVLLMYYSLWGDATLLLARHDRDNLLIAWDHKLFGFDASVALQAIVTPGLTAWMQFAYFFHVLNIPVVACFLYLRRPRSRFREMMCGLLVVCFLGLVGYVLVPGVGPMFTLRDKYTVPLTQPLALFNLQVQFMDFARIMRDVFPSLHVGISFLVWLYAYRNSRKLFFVLSPFILSLWFSTVYLRYHYLVDVLAGLILAPVSFWLANWLFARFGEVEVLSLLPTEWIGRVRQSSWAADAAEPPRDVRRNVTNGPASQTASEAAPKTREKFEFSKLSVAALSGILIIFAVLPYLNTLPNNFVVTYDDGEEILNNPYAHSTRYLRQTFSTHVRSQRGTGSLTNYYRPLMTLGYLVCYKIFGPNAYGFHLTSVVLHAAIVLALFLITLQMSSDRVLALGAAAFFAIHPIHTEPVDWISATTELQLSLFFLLTFGFFLKAARPDGRCSGLAELAMVGSYALALLAKEQALMLPPLSAAYEHFYRADRAETSWRQKVSRYAALWIVAGAYILFRIHLFGSFAPVLQRPQLDRMKALLAAFGLVGQYLWKLLWPSQLCAYYDFPENVRTLLPWMIAGAAALVLCALVFVVLWKRDRLASFGFVWLFLTLVPVLNARLMARSVFAERYLYLPSVGFCWLVAWGWKGAWQAAAQRPRLWQSALATATALVSALCLFRTITRNRDWANDRVLYTRTLACSPRSYAVRDVLGLVYWLEGDVEAARQQWVRSLEIAPWDEAAWNYLGGYFALKKQYDKALRCLGRALQLQPSDVDVHLNLGAVYAEQGMTQQAEEHLRTAVSLAPLSIHAHNLLGKLYFDSGRLGQSEEEFRRSVEIDPNVTGYNHLGSIYLRAGDRDRAEDAFKKALSLNASDSQAHFGLGAIYAERRRTAEALREYQAGLETDPKDPGAIEAFQKLSQQAPGVRALKP